MADIRDNMSGEGDDELLLKPIAQAAWRYRRVMMVALAAIAVFASGVMLFMYVGLPRERFATVGFRLTFDGIERNQLPNGTKFNGAEIVSPPVIDEVFRSNDLQKYGSYADVKGAMFVQQTTSALELHYRTLLSDSKLPAAERARIEDEMRGIRGDGGGQYTLGFRRTERMTEMPAPLLSKILQDTLSIWARQAVERKGAVRYDVQLLSPNAMRKEFLTSEDYVVAADIVRTKILRILKSVDEMAKIPGASSVRIGEEKVALADIRVNLEDLLRFKVEPLIAAIRGNGLSRNAAVAERYIDGRRMEVQRARDETNRRMQVTQEALRSYLQKGGFGPGAGAPGEDLRSAPVTPQLTESFIDRVVDLATRSNDMEYRQELTDRIIQDGTLLAEYGKEADYYTSMQRPAGGAARTVEGEDITKRTNEAFDEMLRLTRQLEAMNQQLAQQNLNPDSSLYAITSPVVVGTVSPLPLRTMVIYLLAVMLISAIVVPLACIAHAFYRSRAEPPSRPSAGAPPVEVGYRASV